LPISRAIDPDDGGRCCASARHEAGFGDQHDAHSPATVMSSIMRWRSGLIGSVIGNS
jgi:hypothetical protein